MSGTNVETFGEGDLFDDGTGFVNEDPTGSNYLASIETVILTLMEVEMAGPYSRVAQGSAKVFRFELRKPDGSLVTIDTATDVIEWSLARYPGDKALISKLLTAGITVVSTGTVDVSLTALETLPLLGKYYQELKARIDNFALDRFTGVVEVMPSSGGVLG